MTLIAKVKKMLLKTDSTMKYYSDPLVMQDKWLLNDVFLGIKNGFYVDVGASGGKNASNTYLLDKAMGWRGICIEPESKFFRELKTTRSNAMLENVCVLDRYATVDFIEAKYYSGVKSELKEWHKDKYEFGKQVKKQAVPFVDILRKHNAPNIIDYLSMDTEGAEYKTLACFPFKEFEFKAMTIEVGAHKKQLENLLVENGYTIVNNPYASHTCDWEIFAINKKLF